MLRMDRIVETFRGLGVGRGDHLFVHSSLRRIGEVEGRGDGLLDALLDVVGTAGTVAVPTFTHRVPEPQFDPALAPSWSGTFTRVLMARPDAVRSLHPTHSIAAIGQRAEEFTQGHHECGACTAGSPIDRIAQAGGYVALLGVSHTASSTIHIGESHAGIRKFKGWGDCSPLAPVRMPDGTIVECRLDETASCSFAFNAVDFPMRRDGMIRDFELGGALCTLMTGRDVIAATVGLLRQTPEALLCTRPECQGCTWRREFLQSGGEDG